MGLIVATTIMLTYSCSNDETVERTVEEVSTLQSSPEFVAKLSEEQKFNAQKTGEVFLQNQQRDAFNATIDKMYLLGMVYILFPKLKREPLESGDRTLHNTGR